MKKLTKLSGNELNELTTMACRMLEQLQDFNHVSELAPKGVIEPITNYYKALCEEHTRRENTLNNF